MRFNRHLKSALLVMFVATSIAMAVPARAQDASGAPLVIVSGDAVVRRAPDVAYLTLSIESRAGNPRDAQRQNADKSAAVQKALGNAGIPRDALKTVSAWLDQEYDNVNGRRVSRGYIARNTLEARVEEIARAGEMADVAVQAGATGLGGVRFDLKDRDGAERDALRLAVENARDRADAAAKGVGRSVDRVVKIEDMRVDNNGPRPLMAMQARADGGAGTSFEPGMLEIVGRVTLTASMK